MDKSELLDELADERQELVEMLEDLPDAALLEPGVVGDWSIKDTLAHMVFWEGQLVMLLFQAQRGVDQPSTIHFGKETTDQVNQRMYEAGKDRPLEQVWADWEGVRRQTIRRVSELSEQDLNDPNRYPWLEGKPLYEWVLNDSTGHEAEHADQIRDWLDKRDTARE